MFVAVNEKAVALDELDPYLKAILKTKVREFIYLNPCFENIAPFNASNITDGTLMAYDFNRLKLERAKQRLERLYSESPS